MREFSLDIEEHLTNGLSPDERTKRNVPFLYEAKNVRCSPYGLREFEPIIDPFSGAVNTDYPFPQIFQTSKESLLLTRNKVYSLDTSIVPWQRSELPTTKVNNNPSAIVSGGRWHFVDAMDMWMAFNGESIVFKDTQERINFASDKIRVINDVHIETGCYHRGRIVIGGFDSENFWGGEWDRVLDVIKDQISEVLPLDFDDMDKNFVLWSSIGGGDFPLWLFKPEMAIFSVMDDHSEDYGFSWDRIDTTILIDVLRRNDFGFMPMPWNGRVIGMAPILNNIVVLGTEGVTGLVLANTEGANTYGRRDILTTGCAGRGAFHASDRRVLFIDSEGSLWQINGELQPSRIGYRKYLSDMLGTNISITWNEEEDEYFISNSDYSFQYTQHGLTRIRQAPTSVSFYQGGNVGLFNEVDDQNILIVTEEFDLGIRGLKTINSLNLGVSGRGITRVAIDYRYDSNDEFTRTPFVQVNREGSAYLRVTCLDFRVVIEHDVEGAGDDRLFELDYVTVRWQASDKRQIRGMDANTTSS